MQVEDVVLIIDCSQSMYQRFRPEAIKPSRIEVATGAAQEFIDGKAALDPRDRVAIVSVGRRTRTLCTLKSVGGARLHLLSVLGNMPLGGSTPLHLGLDQAERVLNDSPNVKRVIVLSDGAVDDAEKAIDISRRMKTKEIFIDAIGIGPADRVRDATLRATATTDANGEPRYRYINRPDELRSYYNRLSSKINISFSATPELDRLLEKLGIVQGTKKTGAS